MFTIQVIEQSSGKPACNKKVAVIFDGWTRGVTSDKYTDHNGECHFDEGNGDGTVYVSGSKTFTGRVEGRRVIYV